ncbi:hypothetical protein [uncultured Brachyspira sp.]|uniref:hypothetical protein n=1 Tax=uncultured Brachyspira sp. TaxID=221953 RepID=UPI00261057BF|nr:hypothetical protein [uncultured Brachyspira sp.]
MNYKICSAIQEYINEIRNLNIISDIKIFNNKSLFIIYLMVNSLDKRIENIELNLRKKYRNSFNKNIYVEAFYSFYKDEKEADNEIQSNVITDMTSNFSGVTFNQMFNKKPANIMVQNNMKVYNSRMKNNNITNIGYPI